ncbi:MAG: alpha/beta-hydrolase family protein [Mesorhizobium sp.]|nr:alpha/beta-hydrolase family protein [Mesorhizobium sp.]MBL8576563.1 alpha/beta-hydrolase family protein [Mesorhizobium sp.]
MFRRWAVRYFQSFSLAGLLIGTLFFAASLTPTLIPRNFLTQGVLSGCSAAAGYGVGFFLQWLWRYLELPEPRERFLFGTKLVAAIICGAIGIGFLWRAAAWQNSIRSLMEMDPVDTAHPIEVGAIAIVTFVLLIAIARLFKRTLYFVSRQLNRFVPKRFSYVAGTAIAALLFWSIGDGIIFRNALRFMDASFERLDALIPPETTQPTDPAKTGSPASLVRWDDLGRMGRSYIGTGPSAADISAVTGKPALEPIRVYVGMHSEDSPKARAKLALEELKRVGGFDRSTLVIITPTGTGWVDEQAIDPIEFLHNGDIASIGAQYSYLASWLSLLVEPGYGAEQARALFSEVYGYWSTLPKETRPKLYLFGLSLGALSSELSNELFEVLGDPYQGALWAGPPFPSRIWNSVTRDRNPGSPAWLPKFRDGSYVRFTAQKNALDIPGAVWGPMRIVYLQYASDPITFYDPHSLYHEPDWMQTPRGPDVSPYLGWYPVVTFLQLTLDIAMATTSPMGYGHVFAAEHYIDSWMQVADIQGWSPDEVARLKQHFIDLRNQEGK